MDVQPRQRAPAASSSAAASYLPRWRAHCRAVLPSSPGMSRSAPATMSCRTASTRPPQAARLSAVSPLALCTSSGDRQSERKPGETRSEREPSPRRGWFWPGYPSSPAPAGVGLQKWHFGQIAPFEPSLHRGSKKPKHRHRTTSIDGDSPTDLRSPPAGDPGRSASFYSHSAA